ncbi:homogentisate 1,2-dioxygenase [Vulcanimicrobium alpinum]|uniref:Homogentisate 1,2-dioxygenase n=1 Tax=Vulcanimicrobium alpinum TaxID=3016050 RepID=A0AAN1XZI4_UNVUL|nr:homogentisate 1,2-dioxygenase [Vulcanimicrobium alpinum]BDE07253.1 homogentisate 1,2-dioxygenase [Vulcanimicrobium alpinum]
MASYVRQGRLPAKRHIQFRNPDGGLYAEELISTKGFESVYSLAYHLRPPTATLDVQPWERPMVRFLPNDPVRNRHWFTGRHTVRGNAVDARVPLAGNDDLVISTAEVTDAMEFFFRNSSGDEMLFVQRGEGVLQSPFGELPYRAHDYLYVPMGTTYRLQPRSDTALLIAESSGQITIPRKFRNEFGQLAEWAPYYERDFRAPALRDPVDATGEFDVRVTAKGRHAKYTVANHPFDVVGWDGYCYPWAFNADEYAPITGKLHQPPSSHQIWDAPGAAFILFAPRMFDYHPEAIPAPYNHSSVDCDEIIYYASGNFMSRRGIEERSVTLHAAGAPHGPQPGAVEASLGKTATDELAVAIDLFHPLRIAETAAPVEDPQYFRSWIAQRV